MSHAPEIDHGEAPTPFGSRAVLVALLALGTVYSALLWISDLLPFVDLPFHLGVATVVRGYGEPGNQFADYFTLQILGQPNVFHLWFCSRDIFPSVEFANKVYFALYSYALPLSLYAVIRELRGNPWFSLLGFLYLYNFNTHWGFVGFVAAMPMVLALFAVLLRHLRRPSWRTRLVLAVGALGLFFVHVLGALFFGLAFGLTTLLCLHRDRRELALTLALMLPLVSVIGVWWFATDHPPEESLFDFLLGYYRDFYVASLRLRSFFFIFDNSYLAGGRLGLIWGALLAGVSVSLLAWAALFERGDLLRTFVAVRNRAVLAFLLAAGFCFLVLPEGLPGQWALNQRFSVYFALGLILLASLLRLERIPKPAVLGVIAAGCLLHAALYADYFRGFAEDTRGFTESILPEAGETRLAGLILEPHYRGTLAYLHFSNYYIVRKQGIAVSRMVDFRFGTVRRKPDGGDLPVALMRFDIDPDYAGQYDEIDYLVVRGDIDSHMRSSLGHFEERKRDGEWALLERR